MHVKSAIRAKYMLDSSEKCKELASSAILYSEVGKKSSNLSSRESASAMSEALIYLGFFGKTARSFIANIIINK